MQCPECQSGSSRVYKTIDYGAQVQRYRRCMMCGHRWKSWEESDKAKVKTYKSRAESSDLFSQEETKAASR